MPATDNYLKRLASGRDATLASMFRRPLVVAGLVTIAVAVVVQFIQLHELRMDSYSQRMQVSAQLSAEQVTQFVNDHQAALSLVAGHRVSDDRWPRRLRQLKAHFPAFSTLLVANRKGRIVYAIPETTGRAAAAIIGRDVSDRPYFKVPIATGDRFVSSVFEGRTFGSNPIIAFSAPLLSDRGKPEGIVEASITADQLARVYGSPLKQRGILFLVVDQDRRVVYASDGLTLKALDELPVALTPTRAQAPKVDRMLKNGEMAYLATSQTPFGWTVTVLHPASIMGGETRRELLSMLGPATLAVFVVVWVATTLARRLSAPIRELSRRIKCHDFDVEMPEITAKNAPRELRELSHSFALLATRMNHALKEAKVAASDLSRTIEERDKVIADRTSELQLVNEELRRASRTDALTGCRNYRGFVEDLARLHHQCRDDGVPLTVISCDIDHFKRYNDCYGHPAGDRCLRRVADALRSALTSPSDVLARVGGEEFVALLPRLPGSAAGMVAERMRRAVISLQLPHADSAFEVVTISLGWGVHLPGSAAPLECVLTGSDAALYVSKQRGRNQVASAVEAH